METNLFFVLVHGLNTSKGEFSTLEKTIFSNFPKKTTKIVLKLISFNIQVELKHQCR
jgi:hypothetical protein